ncbi:DUF6163 family protein [Pseudochelatococcus sp. B33]
MSLPTEQTPRLGAVRDRGREAVGEAPVRELALHLADERKAVFRWDIALVWFMRLVALVWVAKGLVYWALLLGVLPQVALFEGQPLQWQTVVVYFAVIDLVAAVGLWLTSTWGGVMWLLAAMSYFLAAIVAPHAVVSGPILLAGLGALVAAYFLLSWYASRIET